MKTQAFEKKNACHASGRPYGWGLCLAMSVAIAVQGCAHGGPDHIDLSDSYPAATTAEPQGSSDQSFLAIYTDWFLLGNPGDAEAPKKRVYSGYTVYDERGDKKAYVGNGNSVPSRHPISPGRYLILLDEPKDRTPAFWVTVRGKGITEVYTEKLPPAAATR